MPVPTPAHSIGSTVSGCSASWARPLADVNPDADDLRELTRRHLADLDARLAHLARVWERVRAVEDVLLDGDCPGDEALLDLLSGLPADEPALTRRITLLVYRESRLLPAVQRHALLLSTASYRLARRSTDGTVSAGSGGEQQIE
jgi:MerR family transcriptional regulator, thiopeptide resistance regulator